MEKIVAYVGDTVGERIGIDRHVNGRRYLTDWHGNRGSGYCAYSTTWPVRSYIGSRMYQIYATIGTVHYTRPWLWQGNGGHYSSHWQSSQRLRASLCHAAS